MSTRSQAEPRGSRTTVPGGRFALHGIRAGMNDASFASELSDHVAWTLALARQLVRDGAEAEDVAQETLARALAHPPRETGAVRGYLRRVLGNVRDERVRGAGRRVARERVVARPEAEPATDELVERLAWQRRLVEAVERLEEPFRGAILLRFFEELPPRAIAARLGVPVKTVDSRLQRALARLRADLDQRAGGRRGWALALCSWMRSAPAPVTSAARALRLALSAGLLAVLIWSGWRFWPRSTTAGEPGVLAQAERGASESLESSAAFPRERRESVTSSAQPPGRVTGRVLGADGAALAGARVELFQPPFEGFDVRVEEFRLLEPERTHTLSAADGSFVLEAPARVPLRVRAAAAGCGAEELDDVHAGDALELVLERAGRFAVQATRAGEPCVGAALELTLQGRDGPVWRGTTDARGRAEAAGLAGGIYTVECSPADGTREFVLDVALAPGGEASAAFEVDPGRELAGVVRDARSGRPLSSASAGVSVRGSRSGPVSSDANGEFRLRGLPASFPEWTVEVSAEGHAPLRRTLRAAAEPPAVELELAPELRLGGTVVDPSGRPLGAAWIACGSRGARSDEQGRFELGGLSPGGAAVVLVRAPAFAAWIGSVAVGAGETRHELGRIALAPAASLEGRVHTSSGRALSGAHVELQRLSPPEDLAAGAKPEDPGTTTVTILSQAAAQASAGAPVERTSAIELERAGARIARSNALGRFRFDDLAPGRYRILARANGYQATSPREFELAAAGLEGLELEFEEGSSLSGSVHGSDGLPLANAWLVLRGVGLAGGGPVQLSGLDGRFVLRGVPAGPVELEVSYHQAGPDGEYLYLRETRAGLVAPRADLELVLPRNRPIEGRVLDEAGRPLAGYRVRATDADGRALTAEVDAQGRFRVGAAEGESVELELEGPLARDPQEAERSASMPRFEAHLDEVRAGSSGVELRARPRR